MASHTDDRWLWLGLGVFFFAAFKGIQYAMHDLRDLTQMDPAQYPPEDVEARTEDSLKLRTLETLATHYNPSISQAAISIIVSRFMRDKEAQAAVREDWWSRDEETHRKADVIVKYLRSEWEEKVQGIPSISVDDFELPPLSPGEQAELEAEIANIINAQHLERVLDASRTDADAQEPSASFAGWDVIPSQRPPTTHSPEEAELRRRRREAMVLHEGAGRVDERDIYRPSA